MYWGCVGAIQRNHEYIRKTDGVVTGSNTTAQTQKSLCGGLEPETTDIALGVDTVRRWLRFGHQSKICFTLSDSGILVLHSLWSSPQCFP